MNVLYIFNIDQLHKTYQTPLVRYGAVPLLFSWFYALCAQIIIPLPLNFIPFSPHPLPVFLCTMLFGSPAVIGYATYLAQGALGAPFFAPNNTLAGLARLIGPSGGFLFGFLAGALILLALRNHIRTTMQLLSSYWLATSVMFTLGVLQLSLFISLKPAFLAGYLPFVVGDYCIKTLLFIAGYKLFVHYIR